VTSRKSPWDHLLVTAGRFVENAGRDRWTSELPVHDVVGGLCRNAVDGAVRQAVIMEDALRRLDKEGTTGDRLRHVLRLTGGRSSLPRTAECKEQHLRRWNAATHGEPGALRAPREEIGIAAAVCEELQAWRPT
jgi:hypothetical protein